MQPWRSPTHFVRFHICRSEPKNNDLLSNLFSLRRNEAISEEKVFKGGCPPLSKSDFDFIYLSQTSVFEAHDFLYKSTTLHLYKQNQKEKHLLLLLYLLNLGTAALVMKICMKN
ncbi:hypothetical protein HanRHA438_Chr00c32g0855141 [Helianthus annuus]|uniref:Uncharacterized protein n=1 Tax=Helianthus annuus TaxID=4232 RepID=A0A251V5P9_HELAN|nr:hypothetical protein HanXRQr2_Chr03g0094171 [Helianthus annuus]KAJ0606878.1 hypothetical protein HanHA89_Chr03g0090091 [Helianthus annuus]KAJ0954045.1 hypothetical protein HanRHA438_Chr00c32g0855141 [Helianthus annuus]